MSVLAALSPDSTGYRLLYFAHLLCVIGGFGSTFVFPLLSRRQRQGSPGQAAALSETALDLSKRLSTPLIYAAGVFGVILTAAGGWEFGDLWVSLAFTVFIAAAVFSAAVHYPNLRRIAELTRSVATADAVGGRPVEVDELETLLKRDAMNGGLLQLAFVVLMVDMIWKPGL